jgi:hypothetical protein
MQVLLKDAGFEIVAASTDLSRAQMSQTLDRLQTAAQGADIALVFYSGHGMEVGGVNYLIPKDATLTSDRDIKYEAIALDDVLSALDGATRLKIVLLDACRNNPFAASMKRLATRGAATRGLAQVEASSANMLIAYAAAPGATALDGEGANSPFTAALVKHLAEPGKDIRLALGAVRDEVARAAGNRQTPFITGSLGGEPIVLKPTPEVAAPSDGPDAAARRDFALAKAEESLAAWDAFLAKYDKGFYATLARDQRQRLLSAPTSAVPIQQAQQLALTTVPDPSLPTHAAPGAHLYFNPRFGVAALAPDGWRAGPEPENGDGRTFTSPDGAATLLIFGNYRNAPIEEDMSRLARGESGETVTYQKRGKKFVVVSGLSGGMIFYRKSLLSCGNVWNNVSLTYPADQKQQYDALTSRIAGSLQNRASACD